MTRLFQRHTDADGIYHIDNPPRSTYTATVSGQPAGLTVQTFGVSNFSLVSGADRDDIDFGFRGAASISGFVYVDLDNDGVFDPGETPTTRTSQVTLTGDATDLGVASQPHDPDHAGGRIVRSSTNLAAGLHADVPDGSPTQPTGLLDGKDRPGTPFGGTALPPLGDTIAAIVIPLERANVDGNGLQLRRTAARRPRRFRLGRHQRQRSPGARRSRPAQPSVTVTLTGTDDLGRVPSPGPRPPTASGRTVPRQPAARQLHGRPSRRRRATSSPCDDSAVAERLATATATPTRPPAETAAFILGVGQTDSTRLTPVCTGPSRWATASGWTSTATACRAPASQASSA